jgi:hypothetical protein
MKVLKFGENKVAYAVYEAKLGEPSGVSILFQNTDSPFGPMEQDKVDVVMDFPNVETLHLFIKNLLSVYPLEEE